MSIPTFEIEIALGTTKKFRGQLQDEDTGDAQALSTMTKVWLTGKLDVEDDDSEALVSLYWPGGGGTTVDVTSGLIEWKVSSAMTDGLDIRIYDLITDIKGLDLSGDTWHLADGLIQLVPEIHQWDRVIPLPVRQLGIAEGYRKLAERIARPSETLLERQIAHGEAEVTYGTEPPQYGALRGTIEGFYADLLPPLETLQERVFLVTKLPVAKADVFRYTKKMRGVIDRAISIFLDTVAGPDRSKKGFVNGGIESDTPDGIIQQREILAYSVGLRRASDLLDQPQTLVPTRSDPAVKEVLENAFARLSQNGTLRLESIRDEIHGLLVSGTDAGLSPLDVGRQLTNQFEGTYKRFEFERLARTESAFAAIAGNSDQMTAMGVQYVQVLVNAGACPICQAFAEKVIPLEDGDLPPYHPNCCCDISPAG